MKNKFTKDDIEKYWSRLFGDNKPFKITPNDLASPLGFDRVVLNYSLNHRHFLDFGCGFTWTLFYISFFVRSATEVVGIDLSSSAIKCLKETAKISRFDNLNFVQGDENYLSMFKDKSFDMIISSNALDCMPASSRDKAISELCRLLDDNGTLFLKINFYLDEGSAARSGLTSIGDGCYLDSDVFRICFKEDEFWIRAFEQHGLRLVKQDSFQRNPAGKADRIFIFTK